MDAKSHINTIISDRLQKIEQTIGIKPAEMAQIGGCSQATYYRYRKGESVPDFEFLSNILKNENRIRSEWLLKGTGPIFSKNNEPHLQNGDDVLRNYSEIVHLPLYSMHREDEDSEGELSVEKWKDTSKTFPFCKIFLNSEMKSDLDHLFVMKIRCDSMSPDIKPGSVIIANQQKKDISTNGIFIVRFGDIIQMKLLQMLPDNRLHLTTVNKKYDPIEIDLNKTKDFKILGRVVWVGSPY